MKNQDVRSKKAQAALALAVSLWIANGGVASAEKVSVSENTTVSTDESGKEYLLGGNINAPKGEGITFTVENNGKVTSINGNSVYAKSSGNTVIVKEGGKVGPDSDAIIGGLSNNEVSIEGTVTGHVYGGKNISGISTGNHVVVKGTVGVVYGGHGATATNNTVEILGGHAGSVCGGGYGSTTTNNTVVLKNATVIETVSGGWSEIDVTGNTLTISGKNTVGGIVGRLQTIKLASDLEWDSTNTVLTAGDYIRGSSESSIALDISEASALTNHTESGTMTLIKATNSDANLNDTRFTLSGTAITAEGVTVKNEAKTSGANGVTIGYNNIHTVALANENKAITYTVANSPVNKITLGTITWNKNGIARALTSGDYTFNGSTVIDTSSFEFNTPSYLGAGDSMTLLSNATGLTAGDNIAHSQSYANYYNCIKLNATLTGNITRTADTLGYTATGTTLDSVDLANWNGTTTAVPAGWTSNLGANSIKAAGFTAPNVAAGGSKDILTTTTNGFFNDNQITGALKYKEYASSSDTLSGVTLTGSESKGVKAAEGGKNLVYERSNFNVSNISFGKMAWGEGRTASATGFDYSNVTNANIDLSKFTFSNPENISAGGTTTLLVANDTLAAITAPEKNVSYAYSPVAGVTVNGTVSGSYMTTNAHAVQYTATANKANKLTFGNVAWTGGDETTPGTALMTRPDKITFAGAAVDTSNINFTNISELEANKEMTLVAGWDGAVGTITGSKYKVGSTLQGEGHASLEGSNLIFHTDTTAEKMEVQEQTHNTVMGAEVGMAALSAGNDFIASASEGLATPANVGADGVSSYATMGGGSMRQETGSHIDTRTWNAIIALGHKNEKEKSSFEYGAFFEYGRGNYTTYNGAERGDGSMHYTGGGLLAKWQKKDGLYVEGSLRAGSVHDDAHDVLRDVNGTPYSYETNAPYWGAHIGVGKIIALGSDHELDVYGKFYHNHRKGVSFNAGGHYDLDAVNSDVLRIGARYTLKREKWNFYGGLAYEHELDGKASGTADGMKIRSADTSGASLRGELGVTFKPEKEGPLTLDFNVSGFAGKKRGVTGGVSVSLMF